MTGKAYASGKTLVVFVNAVGTEPWHPNKVARQVTDTPFAVVWVVGLHHVDEAGRYVYGVTCLDLSKCDAPAWLVHIDKTFDTWKVVAVQ